MHRTWPGRPHNLIGASWIASYYVVGVEAEEEQLYRYTDVKEKHIYIVISDQHIMLL